VADGGRSLLNHFMAGSHRHHLVHITNLKLKIFIDNLADGKRQAFDQLFLKSGAADFQTISPERKRDQLISA
jgi:hypothetical protein